MPYPMEKAACITSTNNVYLQPPSPTANYANKIVLSEPDAYILYWNYTDQVT